MKRQYTLSDLRQLGVETVSKSAIVGKGKGRREFKAGPNGVVFDFDQMPSEEQLKVGALIAALERKAGKSAPAPAAEAEAPAPGTAKPADIDPETGEFITPPAKTTKKKVAKKAAAKPAAPAE